MTTEKKLLGVNPVALGGAAPEAVSFDGVTDYLSRSDMTGNTDSKTFTFSCWFYKAEAAISNIYRVGRSDSNYTVAIYSNNSFEVSVVCRDASLNTILIASITLDNTINTWNHLLISIDLANTSNKYAYINDISSPISGSTYTNAAIDFTSDYISTAAQIYSAGGIGLSKCRLSNLFLDYTYRDLSVTANRRLFIDADGKPSSTIPSSPILYLPMKDAATAGSNSGTGGDFTVNGVLATAERGPNQDNCSASEFDGSADYIRNAASLSGSTKTFTFTANITVQGNNGYLIFNGPYNGGSAGAFEIYYSGSTLRIRSATAYAGSVNGLITIPASELPQNKNIALHISYDLTDTAKRHVLINNVPTTASWATYTNTATTLHADTAVGFQYSATYVWDGVVGEVYFNNTYTDLTTDNPFWDSDTNRPNSVRKVIADTSVTPLIALPIIGSDAGNNLGTGGDFTVNSGPFTGARGGSEYWSRGAKFDGTSSSYLTHSAAFGTDTNDMTFMAWVYPDTFINDGLIFSAGNYDALYLSGTGGNLAFNFRGYQATALTSALTVDSWNSILINVDSSTSTAHVYINGVLKTMSGEWMGSFGWNMTAVAKIGRSINGYIGPMYVSNSSVDFSQEANRNKFIDQLGYPKDLTQQIDDGDIPNPLIYTKFADTTALGTNSGTGGNYTITGTVTAGADVNP